MKTKAKLSMRVKRNEIEQEKSFSLTLHTTSQLKRTLE